jgi:phosphoribulokinase
VDTSNPFIARFIPTADESFLVTAHPAVHGSTTAGLTG